MSEVYIGPDYYRETDEPAARQVARQAIAERKMRLNEAWMDEFERRQDELERAMRRRQWPRSMAWFVTGIVVGLLSAALLGGLL